MAGRIVTAENVAAPGASVGLLFFDGIHFREIGSTTADAEGRFHFSNLPAADDEFARRYQSLDLYVRAPGSGTAIRRIRQKEEGKMEVRLPRPVDLHIRVADPAGQPLAGVAMRVDTFMRRSASEFVDSPPLAISRIGGESDANGKIVIRGLPAGWDVRLTFDDDRHAPPSPEAIVRWISLGDRPQKTVEDPYIAVAAASVAGRVRYEGTGQPVPGIRVSATSPGSGGMGSADTDREGRFEIKGLPPGAFDLGIVLREDMPDWTAANRPGEYVGAGARLDGQDIPLIKGALITGRLTSAEDGKGIAGQSIGVAPQARQSFWVRFCKTDADGRYQLRVPAGAQNVYLAFGQMPEGFSAPEKKDHKLTVADGETATVDFALRRAVAIDYVSGQVVDRASRPVARARVLMAPDQGHMHDNPEAVTGDDGKFRLKLPKLDADADAVRLLASHAQDGTTAGPVLVRRGESATLTLDPAGLASVSGRVVDVSGQPVAGARVTAYTSLGDFRDAHPRRETDAQGRYRIADLWPGTIHRFVAEARGFASAGAGEVSLTPGEAKQVADLRLERTDLTLAGRVVDAQDRPVAGAVIRTDSSRTTTTTDAQGAFRLENLPAGWTSLSLVHHDQSYSNLLRAKAGSIDVVLEKPDRPGDTDDSVAPKKTLATHLLGKPAPRPAIEPGSWIGAALPDDLAPTLKDKVVLLDFWAVQCGGCIDELPNIEAFWQENKARGLLVLGIGSRRHPTAEVREFLEERKLSITYPLARDARQRRTTAAYGVPVYPCYAVIDRQGRLAYLGHEWADAKAKAAALLPPDAP